MTKRPDLMIINKKKKRKKKTCHLLDFAVPAEQSVKEKVSKKIDENLILKIKKKL